MNLGENGGIGRLFEVDFNDRPYWTYHRHVFTLWTNCSASYS